MPLSNQEIASAFEEIADILEFQGGNSFRVKAYRVAGLNILSHDVPLANIVKDNPEHKDRIFALCKISGIGHDLAEKILELESSGHCKLLEELRRSVPAETLALMRIPGLGPKKAARLHKELGVHNIQDLKMACSEGRVRTLKGFGQKSESNILIAIGFFSEIDQERPLWVQAEKMVKHLIRHIRERAPSTQRIEPAGSFRRCKETVGDIDLLVVSEKPEEVFDALAECVSKPENILLRGEKKISIMYSSMDVPAPIQVDCRVVPEESFGAALQYFTGSQLHNLELRRRAKDLSLLINEYGVYEIDESGRPGENPVCGRTEAEIYRKVNLPWIPPELREMRREFQWAAANRLPNLITLDDICGDLHVHTNDSDGLYGAEAVIQAAKNRGMKYVAITDHTKRLNIANGMDEKRVIAQWKKIDGLNGQFEGITVLKGIEVDILEDGGLDLPDEILAKADWVVASIHFGQNQPKEKITRRLLDAIENPYVSVIAHPTGRIINDRPPYDFSLDTVFSAAAEYGVFLELNSHPKRLDLDDVHCAIAKKYGIKIVISSDAHTLEGLSVLRFGISQARRAGLEPEDVANTLPWNELKKSIRKGKG